MMLMFLLLCGNQAFAAETYICESTRLRGVPDPVYLTLKLEGGTATAEFTIDGRESIAVGTATLWHNDYPNRCVSRAEGYDFKFEHSEVAELHVVTHHTRGGCFIDSFISVNGIQDGQEMSLICAQQGMPAFK